MESIRPVFGWAGEDEQMSAQFWDWLAVGVAILFAVVWLGFRMRHTRRRKKESSATGVGSCGLSCEGCPYAEKCGGKP